MLPSKKSFQRASFWQLRPIAAYGTASNHEMGLALYILGIENYPDSPSPLILSFRASPDWRQAELILARMLGIALGVVFLENKKDSQ